MHMIPTVYNSADTGQNAMMASDTTRASATAFRDSCEGQDRRSVLAGTGTDRHAGMASLEQES